MATQRKTIGQFVSLGAKPARSIQPSDSRVIVPAVIINTARECDDLVEQIR